MTFNFRSFDDGHLVPRVRSARDQTQGLICACQEETDNRSCSAFSSCAANLLWNPRTFFCVCPPAGLPLYLASALPPAAQPLACSDSMRLGSCICHVISALVPSFKPLCRAGIPPMLVTWGGMGDRHPHRAQHPVSRCGLHIPPSQPPSPFLSLCVTGRGS